MKSTIRLWMVKTKRTVAKAKYYDVSDVNPITSGPAVTVGDDMLPF